jgi:hypothetical protein
MLYFALSVPNRRQIYKMQVKEKICIRAIIGIMYSIGITYKELFIIISVFFCPKSTSELHSLLIFSPRAETPQWIWINLLKTD